MLPKFSISKGLLVVLLAGLPAFHSGCGTPTHNPKKSNNRLQIAKDYLSRMELPAARTEARKAVRFDGGNAEAYLVLGLVDFLEASANNRLLEVDDCLTGVDAEGLREEMRGHLQAAGESFQKATEVDPEYSEAYANHGKSLAILEEHGKAIELFEKALETPHRLTSIGLTRADLGWAKFQVGDDAGAAKDLRQALQSNAGMCIAKYRLGRVYFKREEWNKALEQFQGVVADNDCRMQEAHLYLVKTMHQLSMTEDLLDAINACTDLAPDSCIAAECQGV